MTRRKKVNLIKWKNDSRPNSKLFKTIKRKSSRKTVNFTKESTIDVTTIPITPKTSDVKDKLRKLTESHLIGRSLSCDKNKQIVAAIKEFELYNSNSNSNKDNTSIKTYYDLDKTDPTPDMLEYAHVLGTKNTINIPVGLIMFLVGNRRVFIDDNRFNGSLMMYQILIRGQIFIISEALIAFLFDECQITLL